MGALRRVVALFVVLGLLGATSVVMWDRWWHRAGPANPGTTCPQIVAARHRVPLAAIDVHRVALIGDSIMMLASCAIADSLRDLGITTSRHGVATTGLLSGGVDWVAETQRILQAEKPDVVVAIFVGNYWPPPAHDANGAVIQADTPAFYRAWQARAQRLSNEVRVAGARMYWVRPPPITDPLLGHAQQLFDGYRTIRGDHFLASGRVLAGPNGSEPMSIRTCGHQRVVRTPDRVHLTDDGARVYGQQIAHDLTSHWGILVAPKPC